MVTPKQTTLNNLDSFKTNDPDLNKLKILAANELIKRFPNAQVYADEPVGSGQTKNGWDIYSASITAYQGNVPVAYVDITPGVALNSDDTITAEGVKYGIQTWVKNQDPDEIDDWRQGLLGTLSEMVESPTDPSVQGPTFPPDGISYAYIDSAGQMQNAADGMLHRAVSRVFAEPEEREAENIITGMESGLKDNKNPVPLKPAQDSFQAYQAAQASHNGGRATSYAKDPNAADSVLNSDFSQAVKNQQAAAKQTTPLPQGTGGPKLRP
jgi:hypothetical protein